MYWGLNLWINAQELSICSVRAGSLGERLRKDNCLRHIFPGGFPACAKNGGVFLPLLGRVQLSSRVLLLNSGSWCHSSRQIASLLPDSGKCLDSGKVRC